jgi:hypothetical protein
MKSYGIILLLIIHFSLVVLSSQCCKSKKLRSCCGHGCNIFCCNCPCKLSCESAISGDYDADPFNLDYDKREILSKRRFHAINMFEKIDLNKDKAISFNEAKKFLFEISPKLGIHWSENYGWFKQIDTNNDSILSPFEFDFSLIEH